MGRLDIATETLPYRGRFIRLSLASCLLLIGFDRDYVASSSLLDDVESLRMPSR